MASLTLAIDSSSTVISVAFVENFDPVFELDSIQFQDQFQDQSQTVNARSSAGDDDSLPHGYVRKRSKGKGKASRIFPPGASTLLAPMIRAALDQYGTSLKNIDLISVTKGPGSFTSLRVGVVTAKTIAYAMDIPVLGINTLEALALSAAELSADRNDSRLAYTLKVRPVINAQRKQLFSSYFEAHQAPHSMVHLTEISPSVIADIETWTSTIAFGDLITGPGVPSSFTAEVATQLGCSLLDEQDRNCSASTVGRLARTKYTAGERESHWKLEPIYFRPSTAEETFQQKQTENES
jgi:tRNA threonylcarbamoyladenosine biosynthesis protein TsaB